MTKPNAKSTVTSHTASNGDAEGSPPLSEKEMKKALAGYHFEHAKGTPLDYLRDPETGKMPGKHTFPSGVKTVDLSEGIEGADLPAAVFWEQGEWLSDMDFDDRPLRSVNMDVAHDIWVVTGNGMPMDWAFWCFRLPSHGPNAPTGYQIPKHPALWQKLYKEGKAKHGDHWGGTANNRFQYSNPPLSTVYGGSGGWSRTSYHDPAKEAAAATKAKTVTKAPSLPSGTRFRCPGCGHWFKEGDLPGHATLCAGGDSQGITDWAIMCDPGCGCRTLDDVASCKPGFPRSKPKKKEVAAETKPDPDPEPATA